MPINWTYFWHFFILLDRDVNGVFISNLTDLILLNFALWFVLFLLFSFFIFLVYKIRNFF